MAYAAFSVVFGEQPSAAKWNILGTNDAGFNDGTAINDSAILPRHLLTGTGSTNWVWNNHTPTCVGWSGTPTTTGTCYIQMGKTVILRFIVTGTSNATSVSVGLPVTARNNGTYNFEGVLGLAVDNGTLQSTAHRMVIDPGTSTTAIICYHDMATTAWTASGTKTVRGTAIYEAA